jgi:GH18 family chitinase
LGLGSWEASYLGAEVRSQTSIIDITADTQPLWFAYVNPWKINLGLAYYGRGYTLSNTSCTDIGCPYSGPNLPGPCTDTPGLLSLQEINTLIEQKDLVPELITDEMVKQITWDDQWMGYDDDETFALKRQWADSKCLGGTVAWSIDFNSSVGRYFNSKILATTY